MSEIGTGAVERFLTCMAAHDWDGLAATIADEGLTRDGSFCDVIEGKEPYIAFLRDIVPSLKGYRLKVQRVSHVSDRVSYVEPSETFEVDGVPTEVPECILFERNDNGLISHVSVFVKKPRGGCAGRGGPRQVTARAALPVPKVPVGTHGRFEHLSTLGNPVSALSVLISGSASTRRTGNTNPPPLLQGKPMHRLFCTPNG